MAQYAGRDALISKLSNISTKAFYLCGTLLSVAGIVCYALNLNPAIKDGRLSFGYANTTALIIAVCLFITIANFKKTAIHIAAIAIMSQALLLTFSLGGIVIFAIGTLYRFYHKNPKIIIPVIIIAALSITFLIINYQLSIGIVLFLPRLTAVCNTTTR
ncbi:MAG: hypothetical protein LBM98_06135 [Oscillospiraceae bacterium]|nr:hypothetical protein [Oscillospiraceae bacterium]